MFIPYVLNGYAAFFFIIALSMVLFTDIKLSIALLTGAIGMILSGVLTDMTPIGREGMTEEEKYEFMVNERENEDCRNRSGSASPFIK